MTSDPLSSYHNPGLAVFAGIMAGIVGAFNLIYGLLLLFDAELTILTTDGVYYIDITAWGWLLVIFGVVQIFVSVGILSGKTWSRLVGIAWASIIALGQMAFIGASPLWSILIIAFCVMVIYSLAVGLTDNN